MPALDVAARYSEIGSALLPAINPITTAKYGIEVTSFNIENVSLPPEVEQAIDKRGAMTTIGDMGEYIRYNMANAVGEGKAGTMGFGAEFAVAMGVGQQNDQPTRRHRGRQSERAARHGAGRDGCPVAAAAAATPLRPRQMELMNPAQMAQVLGVADLTLSRTGRRHLKGRKIGTQWRITKDAVDAFLKG